MALLKDLSGFPECLEYRQDTYMGRLLFFSRLTDPRTLVTTPAQLALDVDLLASVREKRDGWGDVPVTAYTRAQWRVRSILHPDSQRPVLLPFRFSAFIPMNFVNLCGMLHPTQQTPLRAMFWQFSNQTYNVGFNYCNSSGEEGLPLPNLLAGYFAATGTACGLSFALSKYTAAAGKSALLRLAIPYAAVAAANLSNLFVIRYRDLLEGIAVKDAETKEPLCPGERSRVAGWIAVTQVGVSRGLLVPIPLMLFPPLIMKRLFDPAKGISFFVRRSAHLYMPVNVAVLITMLGCALPVCVSIFPQDSVVPASWLEERFQKQTNSRGHVVENVTFNKGL